MGTQVSQAYETSIFEMSDQVTNDVEDLRGSEGLRELQAFKQQVEQEAYAVTLRLCEGYRRVMMYGPPKYHGKYMYSKTEALLPWIQLYKEGLFVVGSAVLGNKRTYNDLYPWKYKNSELSLGSRAEGVMMRITHELFISNYMLFLIESLGYVQAAVHCLDTTNTRELNKFTKAIIAVDFAGTATTDIVTGALIGKVIRGAVGWGLFPFRWINKTLSQRIAQAKLKASYELALTTTVAGALKYFEITNKQHKELIKDGQVALEKAIAESQANPNQSEELKRRKYVFRNLVMSFNKAYQADEKTEESRVCLEELTMLEDSSQDCLSRYEVFLNQISSAQSLFTAEDFEQDLSRLENSPDQNDQSYRELLKIYLPLFDLFFE